MPREDSESRRDTRGDYGGREEDRHSRARRHRGHSSRSPRRRSRSPRRRSPRRRDRRSRSPNQKRERSRSPRERRDVRPDRSPRHRTERQHPGSSQFSTKRRREEQYRKDDEKHYEFGKQSPGPEEGEDKADVEKPNFEITGKLSEGDRTTSNGLVLKFGHFPDLHMPEKKWRLYCFKGDEVVDMLHIHRKEKYLIGHDRRVADIVLMHESCSKQHAVLAFRKVNAKGPDGETLVGVVKPYLMDLGSTNGTKLNGEALDPRRFYEMLEKDIVQFGYSTREYVLLHDESTDGAKAQE